MSSLVKFTADEPGFSAWVREFAKNAWMSEEDAFVEQSRLLAAELMQNTPPHSKNTLMKMAWNNPNISLAGFKSIATLEDSTAKAIGERRVEKDIRKVIYGVRGASPSQPAQVYKGQDSHKVYNESAVSDWGVFQKCEGKPAVRIFATKSGTVYGVDLERFKANATNAELMATHAEHRGKRGRVTTAGSRDRVVGRWRWLNVLTTLESTVKGFIKLKQRMVGQAKGGWAAAFIKLGGRMSKSGWVGRHAEKAGRCEVRIKPGDIHIEMINQSAWASGGDDERIIEKSIAGREKAIQGRIARELDKHWGKGAGADYRG
jgi:hypothetical protein